MEIIKSKKFQAALIGMALLLLEQVVPGISTLPVNEAVGLLAVYIIGQGLADFGKERAKVEAKQNEPPQ